jgi:CHAT domain-containing protein
LKIGYNARTIDYNNLLNLGDTYAALKSKQWLNYYKQVSDFADKKEGYEPIYLAAVLNRGIAYLLVNQQVVAKENLEAALKLSTIRADSAMCHIELAKLYLLDSKHYSLSEAHAKKALKQCADYPKGHPILAEIYTVLGQIYLKINQLEQAKKAFQDALGDEKAKSYRSNWQIEALTQLAELQSKQNVQEASQTYEFLSKRLYERKSFFKTDASKLNLTQQARTIYEKSIHLNHQLFCKTNDEQYLNRILTDMERSKAVLLSDVIQDTRINNYYDVPDSVRTQERNLKLAVAQAERQINQDTNSLKINQTDLSTKYNAWQGFVQHLKQKYPKYYHFKHAAPPLLEVQSIQKQLPNNALLLNYYLTDTILHILATHQSTSKSYEIALTQQFDTVYKQYQRLLAQETWDWGQNPVFSEAAHQLYQYLLEKPLQDFKTKDLIIIPDDKLASFSFFALFTKPHLLDDKHDEPYLIHQYSVNMAYTLNDLGIEPQMPHFKTQIPKSKYVYAGFSHDFNISYQSHVKAKTLGKLLQSKAHIKQINQLFKRQGQTFTDALMTLASFKSIIQESRITELISHASFDEHDARKAFIAFPNAQAMDLLEIKNIYNLNCNGNELLALIACETGRGLPLKSETIISMGYAFAYSGSRRRISALWSIPHEQSMQLMNIFFENIAQNQIPAIALQNAQIAFLKKPNQPATSQTPNLWAGLILAGNIAALSE